MNSSQDTGLNIIDSDHNFNFQKEFFKYLYYWKYFLLSTLVFLLFAFTYLRYSPKVYYTTAKIKILDKKETSLDLPSASELFSKSKINLENEIEVIKSYPILKEVIKNINLQISVLEIGNVVKGLTVDYPFDIALNVPVDSISQKTYRLNNTDKGFEIIDFQNESKSYYFNGTTSSKFNHELPFEILNYNQKKFAEGSSEGYEIKFLSVDDLVKKLKSSLNVVQTGKESDIIELNFSSTNTEYSKAFLNELIDVFNNDGVQDRQLIHKRTIDFVNSRYSFLSLELDSIEIAKQLYKIDNNLVDFSANSEISLEKSLKSEENIYSTENQISITNFLLKTLNNNKLELLPANMLIENNEINELISKYNLIILDRKKLIFSAGSNNPSAKQLDNTIVDFRSNIIYSLQNHLSQLENIKSKLSNQFYKYNNDVSNFPEKEKILRAIERNQKIKESLYLFLLQKREEAQVSYAVTEPSIKIVENAISSNNPISPKRDIVYLAAIVISFLLPFSLIYLMFFFNRKLYSREQLEELKLPIPVVAEIPEIQNQTNNVIVSSKERSPLAESFRVFYSKLKYYGINDKKDCHVIMITSIIKGEGKTFCATNMAFTKATLDKKVLLIGADLHNPQIHTYLNIEKNTNGLVNFLVDSSHDWKKDILKSESVNCDILIGGQIPPNPAQLLNNGNFEKLLDDAKKIYDYIIVDTPPCLLVSDTLGISHLSDLLLFVIRCNHTEIPVLDFIKDSYEKNVIKDNSLIVLNGLGASNKYGYGYAYNYSYGYKYKYSYNYNYGYGYDYQSED
ncbi:MAG: polysaccharide biosynthesis tyrosine autokinase [Bacteroidota bacterium]|nr:polysaccharide biosynthesis tyrosine autokinase [Bacteroidota bacterium]